MAADAVVATVSNAIWPATVALSDLCDDCKTIPFFELLKDLQTTPVQPHHNSRSDSRSYVHNHKASLSALQSSSQCSLCVQVLLQLEEQITNNFSLNISDFKDTPITMSLWTTGDLYSTRAVQNDQMQLGYIWVVFFCHLAGMHLVGRPPAAFFLLCIPDDSMLRKHIPGRLVKPHSTPDELIATARRWLEECDARECAGRQNFHSICQRPVQVLPSRILDIGPPLQSQHIRLLNQTSDIIAPYVALSHCWGLNPSFITTTENLTERNGGIEVLQMPQTFQDAVLVTRLMGFRYLWIDSLCILQDNEEDWLHESALMGPVYKNASLVIGAARAAADTEGFLSPRIPPRFLVATDTPTSIGTQERVFLVPFRSLQKPMEVTSLNLAAELFAEPLSTRAWTFQERYLARRTLFFGREQMFWECQVLLADESGQRIRREDNLLGIVEEAYSNSLLESGSAYSTPLVHEKPFRTWNLIIESYLRMDLTKESDRLPALSGLAAAIGDITGDKFIAGLWLRDLDAGLLWYRCLSDFYSKPRGEIAKLSRPKAYRAPSWSWAAVDGLRNFRLYYSSRTILFSRVSHRIDNKGESRYGPVLKGFLELKGPVFAVTKCSRLSPGGREFWEYMDLEGNFTYYTCYYEQLVEVTINDLTCHIAAIFDFPSEDRRNLFVLFMVKQDDHTSHPVHLGLIIRATGQNPEVYERVGGVNGVFMHVRHVPENPEAHYMTELPSIYSELMYRRYAVYVPRREVPPDVHLVAPDLENCEKTAVNLF